MDEQHLQTIVKHWQKRSDLMANMNVGVPNFSPTYEKMNVEEYKKMAFVPTQANLEKRRLEQEQATLQDQQQVKWTSTGDLDNDSFSATASTSVRERADSTTNSRPEVRRLSGNFNAPTHIEVERHNEAKPSGFRGKIKGWMKRSPPTVA